MKQMDSRGPAFLWSRTFSSAIFAIVFSLGSGHLGRAADLDHTGHFPKVIAIQGSKSQKNSQPLLDLSGLTWLGRDLFLTVQDAKNPKEIDFNRVAILELPKALGGLLVTYPTVRFPGEQPNDLESAAGIPGTNLCLLAESGDSGNPSERIFLARVWGKRVKILDFIEWGDFTPIFDVEATAVTSGPNGLVFLWAERNSGSQSTSIQWTGMTVSPFKIGLGGIKEVKFTLPADLVDTSGNPLYNRAVVGMDLDSAGNIYTIASFDPEDDQVENPDNGPFRSTILQVGRFVNGNVELAATPTSMGVMDGLKAEAVVVREKNSKVEIYFGTDDENYGGIFRFLPSPDFP